MEYEQKWQEIKREDYYYMHFMKDRSSFLDL